MSSTIMNGVGYCVNSGYQKYTRRWLPLILVTLLIIHSVSTKTCIQVPRRPPSTTFGSFQYITTVDRKSTRDVLVYWHDINNEKCNKLLEYRAYYTTKHDNITIYHPSNSTHVNQAMFLGLSTNIGYNIEIYSININVFSTEYATIYVPPSASEELEKLSSLTKTEYDEPGVFKLTWVNSEQMQFSTANNFYTLFWCEIENNYPYQCNSNLNWTSVLSSKSQHIVSVSNTLKNYQFAISANSKVFKTDSHNNIDYNQFNTLSTGMVWELCTLPPTPGNGKIKNFWITVISGTYIAIRWKLDCTDTIGLIKQYRVMVCPLVSIHHYDCKEPMKIKIINLRPRVIKNSFQSYIFNLQPSTMYKTAISITFKNNAGIFSDPVRFTTSNTNGTITL